MSRVTASQIEYEVRRLEHQYLNKRRHEADEKYKATRLMSRGGSSVIFSLLHEGKR